MKLLNIAASIRIFIALSAALLLAFALGGIIPQGLRPEEYTEMFGRIGGGWVLKGGLGAVFSSYWFLALLAAAALNLLACTIRQGRIVRQRPGLFLSHLGVLLMFAGGLLSGLFAVRGTLGLEKGVRVGEFTDARGRTVKLPFELELKAFTITYWDKEKHFIHAVRGGQADGHDHGQELLESVEVREGETAHFTSEAADLEVLKYYPDFSIGDKGPVSFGAAPNNPALSVRVVTPGAVSPAGKMAKPAYLFAHHPDFHGVPETDGVRYVYELRPGRVKQYESRLAFLENGAERLERTLSVNSPADYGGFRLYQSGFSEENPDFSSLQIVRDPGVWLIYSGFAIIMLGFTWAFRREF